MNKCIFFGKIDRIKMLEEIIGIYLTVLKHEDIGNKLNRYENKLKQVYEKPMLELMSELSKIIKKQIENERKCIYKYNNEILDKCKDLIEYTLEYIFGIGRVYLYIITEEDKFYSVLNSEIYCVPYFKIRITNYNVNRTICYKYFNFNNEIIIDEYNREMTIYKIRKNINISISDGLYFNEKYKPCIFLLLPEKMEESYYTKEEWVSIILHEIGHIFSYILFDINKLNDRINEKFADLFVLLYGYGTEFINTKRKELSIRIYYKYINKIKSVYKTNIIKSVVCINKHIFAREDIFELNKHSCIYTRIISLLKQIQLETKYNTNGICNTNIKKELKKIKQIIKNIKKPYYIPDIDIRCKLYIKNNYVNIMNNFHLDTTERISEKLNKLDKRLFRNIIRNLYNN